MNPYINLKNCKNGDLLVLKDGSLAQYVEHRPEQYFPHDIQYYNEFKSKGTRFDVMVEATYQVVCESTYESL